MGDSNDKFARHPFVVPGTTKRIESNSLGFQYCSEIIIEEGVEEIGGWAFTCSTVDAATIPASVTKIEENPFPHTHIFNVVCKSPYYSVKDDILIENDTMRLVSFVGKDRRSGWTLSDLHKEDPSQRFEYTIPSYIRTIGQGCFRGRKLDKVVIPDTVEKILENPFVDCSAEVINQAPNYKIENGLLIEISTNTLLAYLGKDKDIIVPDGIEIIGGSAFELLEYGVDSITFPDSLKEIHDNFGEDCGLKRIFVPVGKEEFFKGLLPKYDDMIKPVNYEEPEFIPMTIAEMKKEREAEEKQRREENYIRNHPDYNPNCSLGRKIFGWIGYIPLAVITYELVYTILLFCLPYVARLLFWLMGFDYTPEPYLFDFERKIGETRILIAQTIEEYVTLTLVILISFVASGYAAGFVANYICPSKRAKVVSIPLVIVLSLISILYLIGIWDNDSIYRSLVVVVSAIMSIGVCYVTCEEDKM